MRFLSIYKHTEGGAPPSEEEMVKLMQLAEDSMKAGWLVSSEGCYPSSSGARVESAKGKVTVTDGPFAEAKEVVGGFSIIKAASLAEAIQLTKDFLAASGADDCECELRQLYEAP